MRRFIGAASLGMEGKGPVVRTVACVGVAATATAAYLRHKRGDRPLLRLAPLCPGALQLRFLSLRSSMASAATGQRPGGAAVPLCRCCRRAVAAVPPPPPPPPPPS
jgi:hypothetical protein